MQHYYVINGNEYGMDLHTKQNFTTIKEAKEFFDKVKENDFGCVLMYADKYGNERRVEVHRNG